eukprot:g2177.t1
MEAYQVMRTKVNEIGDISVVETKVKKKEENLVAETKVTEKECILVVETKVKDIPIVKMKVNKKEEILVAETKVKDIPIVKTKVTEKEEILVAETKVKDIPIVKTKVNEETKIKEAEKDVVIRGRPLSRGKKQRDKSRSPTGMFQKRNKSKSPIGKKSKSPTGMFQKRNKSKSPTGKKSRSPTGMFQKRNKSKSPIGKKSKSPTGMFQKRNKSKSPTGKKSRSPTGMFQKRNKSKSPIGKKSKSPTSKKTDKSKEAKESSSTSSTESWMTMLQDTRHGVALSKLQAQVRGVIAREEQALKSGAATTLQLGFKALKVRREFAEKKFAAVVVQSLVRSKIDRKRFLRKMIKWRAAISIQQRLRNKIARRRRRAQLRSKLPKGNNGNPLICVRLREFQEIDIPLVTRDLLQDKKIAKDIVLITKDTTGSFKRALLVCFDNKTEANGRAAAIRLVKRVAANSRKILGKPCRATALFPLSHRENPAKSPKALRVKNRRQSSHKEEKLGSISEALQLIQKYESGKDEIPKMSFLEQKKSLDRLYAGGGVDFKKGVSPIHRQAKPSKTFPSKDTKATTENSDFALKSFQHSPFVRRKDEKRYPIAAITLKTTSLNRPLSAKAKRLPSHLRYKVRNARRFINEVQQRPQSAAAVRRSRVVSPSPNSLTRKRPATAVASRRLKSESQFLKRKRPSSAVAVRRSHVRKRPSSAIGVRSHFDRSPIKFPNQKRPSTAGVMRRVHLMSTLKVATPVLPPKTSVKRAKEKSKLRKKKGKKSKAVMRRTPFEIRRFEVLSHRFNNQRRKLISLLSNCRKHSDCEIYTKRWLERTCDVLAELKLLKEDPARPVPPFAKVSKEKSHFEKETLVEKQVKKAIQKIIQMQVSNKITFRTHKKVAPGLGGGRRRKDYSSVKSKLKSQLLLSRSNQAPEKHQFEKVGTVENDDQKIRDALIQEKTMNERMSNQFIMKHKRKEETAKTKSNLGVVGILAEQERENNAITALEQYKNTPFAMRRLHAAQSLVEKLKTQEKLLLQR